MFENNTVCRGTAAIPLTIHIVAHQVFPVTLPLLGDRIEPVEYLITILKKWRMRYYTFHILAHSVTLALRTYPFTPLPSAFQHLPLCSRSSDTGCRFIATAEENFVPVTKVVIVVS